MTPTDASKEIQAGLNFHCANQFADAEKVYRRILAAYPNHPDALHLLGTLFGQTGRKTEALLYIERACAAHPNFAPFQLNYGNALRGNGRLPEAIEAYRKAIRLDPASDKGYSNLGIALRESGRVIEAIAALRRAVEINPNSAIAYDNLGIVLVEDGKLDAAIAAHSRAIELDPQAAAAALSNLSIPLRLQGRLDEAIAACHRSLDLRPDNADAYNNLGVALGDKGEPRQAIDAYEKALALNPAVPGARMNLGISRADIGDIAGALVLGQQAVTEDPSNARAHFNFAISLLLIGDFERGWDEYEWRWKCPEHAPPLPFREPRWDGRRFDGRTIFIHAEQGLGDTIQFVRYAPRVAALGGRVLLGCHPSLRRLLEGIEGIDQIVPAGEVPPFDVHCPVVSLAHAFKTRAESIPAGIPYIFAREQSIEDWRQAIETVEQKHPEIRGGLRVGLAWAGAAGHRNDRNRSTRLKRLAPLASPGITFYSLQKGPPASEAGDAPPGMRLIDLTENLTDFAETAGLIANLDLVICVDTAVAHLAGAMGKPVWVLLPFHPDWRWLLDREDSPWYPTMRLFRQHQIGAWDEVVDHVARELRSVVAGKSGNQ